MASDVKKITKIQWPVVGSVVVGLAAFGVAIWAVKKLPSNPVTAPVKKAADVVSN